MLRILIITVLMMLSQRQIEVVKEPLHDFNILSGVTGSAKTFVANIVWYRQIIQAKPNSRFIQSGNTEESIYDNVTSQILEIDSVDRALDYVGLAQKKRLIVKATNTQVICTGANTEKAQDRIQGKSVDGWYADEIVKQPKSFIDMAISRCRQNVNGKLVFSPMIWTCNPDSPSHYIKTNFINKIEDPNDNTIDGVNWEFGFYDNPLMTKDYVDKMMRTFSGVFYERMILGKWVLAEGIIYDKYNRREHVKDLAWWGKRKERVKSYFLGIDWGYSNPMAIVLFAEDGDGILYAIDEIYVTQISIKQELKDTMTIKGWFELGIEYAMADKSRPDSIVDFSDLTGIDTYPASHSVKNDYIMEVQKRYIAGSNGEYGIYYIGEKVPYLLKEKDNYRWKENSTKDEPVKEKDHGQDAEQYLIYSRKNTFNFMDSTMEGKLRVENRV